MMKTNCALVFLIVAIAAALIQPARAQNQTGLGAFTLGNDVGTDCPSAPLGAHHFAPNMHCYTGNTISSCTNAESITLSFGYLNPSGTAKGTIVLLPGAGGRDAGPEQEATFAADYVAAGFQVVQLQWDLDWEDVTNGNPNSGFTPNIEVAACRPATFLNYIYLNYYSPIQHNLNSAGMCTQGFSAGSGAVGYSLAWYGAYKTASKTQYHIDKADLLSGPVFSDIKLGCEVPNIVVPTVCSGSPSYCQLGGQQPWADQPYYTNSNGSSGPLSSMQTWRGEIPGGNPPDATCQGSASSTTQAEANWLDMSIVNQGNNPPVLNYPDTVVTSWLCVSPGYQGAAMNNAAAQGWFFDDQVTAKDLALYAVEACPVPEAVYGSAVQGGPVVTYVPGLPHSPDGKTAIEADMIASCQKQ